MSIKKGDIITASCGCIGVVGEIPDRVYSNWLKKHGVYTLDRHPSTFPNPRLSTSKEIKEYKSYLFKAGLKYQSGEIVEFNNEF